MCTKPYSVPHLANKLLAVLSQPCAIAKHQIYISASIGVTLFPMDGEDVETLIRNADTAMYYAKRNGRNEYQYFSREMNQEMHERMELATDLRQALQTHQLELHYQPKASLVNGELSGWEALIRWQHPERGMIPPGKFIPVAEECGLIEDIGLWVIETACTQVSAWLNAGLDPKRVAVNLSAGKCRMEGVLNHLQNMLDKHKLAGDYLEVEITESMVMQDTEETIRAFQMMRAMSVHVAIDDFGTGYSSLSYLKKFPITCLKIDKSFVDGIGVDGNDEEIVRAIIAMAHSLGLTVVAEGVEQQAQMNFLRQNACDEIQGYYFSKPLPVTDATAFLASKKILPIG